MRALVVDDSKPVRSILMKMLKEIGFEVADAAEGQEAIRLLDSAPAFDLLILNWNMPIVDGESVLKKMKDGLRYNKLVTFIISAASDPQIVATTRRLGAKDFLLKPVSREDLILALERAGLRPKPLSKAPEIQGTATTKPLEKPLEKPVVAPATPAGTVAPVRVMIVDDSVVVRGVLSAVIENEPGMTVAASASDGRIALEKLIQANPDVIVLDVEMPNMDGIEALKAIRKIRPRLPVVMFSSLTERGAKATLDAIMLGANDYVLKPGGTYMRDVEAGKDVIRNELLPKLKAFGGRVAIWHTPATKPVHASNVERPKPKKPSIIAMGVSTGGPQALADLLPVFAKKCPVPVVIVQHMPPLFTKFLVERLRDGSKLQIDEATDGQFLEPGRIYLAPGGYHLYLKSAAGRIRVGLNQDPPENSCRPSVDVLFRSVAKVYGPASLGIVLTGMGDDGTRGSGEIYRAGGQIIVQDEASSVVWGMPGNVVRAGFADKILPLSAMGAEISSLFR